MGVVFNADHPLVLTDDVKLKFYCSNVSIHKVIPHIISTAFSHRNQYQLALISVSFTSGSTPLLSKTRGECAWLLLGSIFVLLQTLSQEI